jgi:hypothetical protein
VNRLSYSLDIQLCGTARSRSAATRYYSMTTNRFHCEAFAITLRSTRFLGRFVVTLTSPHRERPAAFAVTQLDLRAAVHGIDEALDGHDVGVGDPD